VLLHHFARLVEAARRFYRHGAVRTETTVEGNGSKSGARLEQAGNKEWQVKTQLGHFGHRGMDERTAQSTF